MSDDMGDKIKQIAEMLGQDSNSGIPDNVKGLLNMFMSQNSSKDETSSDDTSSEKENPSEDSSRADTDDLADMARKMKKAMNLLNTNNDPRVNLLNAIKPYLNDNRQKKLQNCMKIIKIGSLTKMLDESEGRSV
ncbi:hypothetical protein Cpap_2026 [Ruminiclostridium papyrosolvens DSM 2782]|uniref:Uncharacterized protein n=1 Tax=Ruminiclostridium papyrosolvens DSM 2782 TaxID=588581 RepID=F1TDZ7_9FIRM|nr:hypothetical protein [Ruminiclostridium papyrosolvens]EGD47443.1 hypothetical protein Cpap_2026 [Ruminiclostridium papyrosolvens DSM 2782]WES34788.1 hypothetical protein P0092_02060 [Ruminiclostridium papyrosolvens DSM 2782]